MPFIYEPTGEVVHRGSIIRHDDAEVEILFIEPPHKPSASGYITTTAGRFYASVYDCKWKDTPFTGKRPDLIIIDEYTTFPEKI